MGRARFASLDLEPESRDKNLSLYPRAQGQPPFGRAFDSGVRPPAAPEGPALPSSPIGSSREAPGHPLPQESPMTRKTPKKIRKIARKTAAKKTAPAKMAKTWAKAR